jgi:hypothetical protein
MIPGKFIGWVLNGIPSMFNRVSKWRRKNEVESIDDAVNSGNEQFINNKLHDIKKRYEADRKANS